MFDGVWRIEDNISKTNVKFGRNFVGENNGKPRLDLPKGIW